MTNFIYLYFDAAGRMTRFHSRARERDPVQDNDDLLTGQYSAVEVWSGPRLVRRVQVQRALMG